MLLLGQDLWRFFQNVRCDIQSPFVLRSVPDGFSLTYLGEEQVETEIFRCSREVSWVPKSDVLKGIVLENDVLLGLVRFGKIRLVEETEQIVGFAEPRYGSSIIVLKAQGKFELFKKFVNTLWDLLGKVRVQTPKSLIDCGAVENFPFDGVNHLVMVKSEDEDLVHRFLQKGFQVVLKIDEERKLGHFYKMGVRYFFLKNFDRQLCERLSDCHFVIEHGSLGELLGLVHGVVLDTENLTVEDLLLTSLLNRLIVLYTKTVPNMIRFMDVLGFGAIGWSRSLNSLFTRIEQIENGLYRIYFVNERNLPSAASVNTYTSEINWVEDSQRTSVRRYSKLNDDGRYFHFYVEGENECSS